MAEDRKRGFSHWTEFNDAEQSVKEWGHWMLAVKITLAVIVWFVALLINWKFGLLICLLVGGYYSFVGLRILWRKDQQMKDLKRRVKEYREDNGHA